METLPRTLGTTPTGDRPVRAVVPQADERTAAFERLVAEQQPRIARLASRLLGWAVDVDDVVQDVFMQAWAAMPKFRAAARPETWLARITINLCRSRRRRQALWSVFWRRETENHAASAGQDQPAEPINRYKAAEERVAVREAILALPAAEREVIVLRDLEELSAIDVALILNVSRGAVDVRLSRARARLRTRLRHWMESSR